MRMTRRNFMRGGAVLPLAALGGGALAAEAATKITLINEGTNPLKVVSTDDEWARGVVRAMRQIAANYSAIHGPR